MVLSKQVGTQGFYRWMMVVIVGKSSQICFENVGFGVVNEFDGHTRAEADALSGGICKY
jgi:hypothetical protein